MCRLHGISLFEPIKRSGSMECKGNCRKEKATKDWLQISVDQGDIPSTQTFVVQSQSPGSPASWHRHRVGSAIVNGRDFELPEPSSA